MALDKEKGVSNGIKVKVMMECGKLAWKMDMELGRVQQVIHMKDNGKQTNNKDMEYITILIVFMKDSLLIFWNMVKGNNSLLMVMFMKANMFSANQINGEFILGKMAISIKVNFKMVFVMVTEL